MPRGTLSERVKLFLEKSPKSKSSFNCEFTEGGAWIYGNSSASISVKIPHDSDFYTQIERWVAEGRKRFLIDTDFIIESLDIKL